MRVDFRRKGYVLFNRRMNVLGNEMQGDIGTLPLERFEVEEIPLSGELVERHGDFTDVFFYSDRTNPYAGDVPDFGKLKVYNRYMYPLSVVCAGFVTDCGNGTGAAAGNLLIPDAGG